MLRETQLVDLIGRIYDAALDPKLWPNVLARLVEIFHGRSGCLYEQDPVDGRMRVLASLNLSPQGFADYEAYYWKKDIWTPKPDVFSVGTVSASHLTTPDRVLRCSEFYHDFMQPNRLGYAVGGFPVAEGQRMFLLGIHRPTRHGPYDDANEVRDLQRLFPHLKRALQIQHRLGQAAAERDGLLETLDHLSLGVILFDTKGRISHANRAAEAICRDADGLTIRQRTLSAASSEESARLSAMIGRAVATARGAALDAGDGMTISRPSGKRPLAVLVSPLRAREAAHDQTKTAVAVFVSDPERTPEVLENLLARLYGLTGAEANLVRHLLTGRRLKDIADASRRSLNTVRAQLKHVFVKTGTNRQSELVRLLFQHHALLDGSRFLNASKQ